MPNIMMIDWSDGNPQDLASACAGSAICMLVMMRGTIPLGALHGCHAV